MNTNTERQLLLHFLAKIVINKPIWSASPLFLGWHGFLLNKGELDQKLVKSTPFVDNVGACRVGMEPDLGEDPAPGVCIDKGL